MSQRSSTLGFGAAYAVAIALGASVVAEERRLENTAAKQDEKRLAPVHEQDDHLHTTPDVPYVIFDVMDRDDDRRVQWDEVQRADADLAQQEFKRLDTDGSGDLDREEYVAVSPSPESDYRERGMPEP